MVDWWGKLRKAWGSVAARFIKSGRDKKKKSKNNGAPLEAGNSGYQEADHGYLKLQKDVENCEYEDVHVLWNMLTHQLQGDGDVEEAAMAVPPAPPPSTSSSPPSPSPSSNDSATTTGPDQKNKSLKGVDFVPYDRKPAAAAF